MNIFLEVKTAEYLGDYCLMIGFNNGMSKIVDLSDVVSKYPVFQPLQDKEKFCKFTITDTLEWNDGKIDISPEFLFEHGKKAYSYSPENQFLDFVAEE